MTSIFAHVIVFCRKVNKKQANILYITHLKAKKMQPNNDCIFESKKTRDVILVSRILFQVAVGQNLIIGNRIEVLRLITLVMREP